MSFFISFFNKSLPLVKAIFILVVLLNIAANPAGLGKIEVTQKIKNYEAMGRAAFQKGEYDKAIIYYRKHLRLAKTDTNAWNEIAAAYYHTGLPKRALRYLKNVEKKTTNQSYNQYYQGLCYSTLGMMEPAKKAFYNSARYTDEYASRATFEIATIEYNDKNDERARYWLLLYLQKYPTGVYSVTVKKMLDSLQQGKHLKGIKGVEKPDMEKALYKYSPLSLYDKPHYWFFQLGYTSIDEAGQEPNDKGGLKANNTGQQGIIANTGIGLGPYQENNTTAWCGYSYRQLWLTDSDRLSIYLDDPSDFEYQPFRADLLERRHEIYGDFRRKFLGFFYMGLYGRQEFIRIGSSLMPSPKEDSDLKRVLKVADTTVFIPWVGVSYAKNFRTLVYVYLKKEINEESPEDSNKTFELGLSGGGGKPFASYGLSHFMEFPDYNVYADIELFQYSFVYNDYWLDYDRQGALGRIQHEIIPHLFIDLAAGMYQDSYILDRLKMTSCSTIPRVGEGSSQSGSTSDEEENVPLRCPRQDTGTLFQGGISWNYSQFHKIELSFTMVENTNPKQKEYEESQKVFKIEATMAFPSVKRVTRFIERFADTAFTKEAD